MILMFLIIGLFSSVLGALPLGASNIAVINTTLNQNIKQALKIAITAGIAEVILSYYALHCNMVATEFFFSNKWLQVLVAIIFLSIGSFLFFRKKADKSKTDRKRKLLNSKYFTGFLLGLLNPPVLIYWLLIYGIINSKVAMLSITSPIVILLLFFLGVYLGKVLTLYIYSRFSLIIKTKFQSINLIMNKVTGVLLFTIGIFQVVKLYLI